MGLVGEINEIAGSDVTARLLKRSRRTFDAVEVDQALERGLELAGVV